jgi:TolB-like protein/DNA-binding winged helix-turn-helix (wHTH) protein/Tfp pilus assembly protein PilF
MLDSAKSLFCYMTMPGTSSRVKQFGIFELDLQRVELRKQGVKVKLQEQPLKILQLLLEHPGEIISRKELRSHIWPEDTFVEFDQGLYSAMARLRDALGDTSESPRYIETVARRGYRFIAQVRLMGGIANSEPLAESQQEEAERKTVTLRRLAATLVAGLIFGALLLAIVLIFDVAGTRQWLRARTTPIRSIAVLPVENLSGDPAQEYFADGMTEELTTDLGKISALRVISRTSAIRYKGTKKSLADIARELNVDAVVEGTVARSGSHLRITANLLQAFPEKHLWAESYDSEVGDALTVQGQIARAVAREIQVKLTRQEQNLLAVARPVNPEAQDFCLKGFFTMRGFESAESSEKAIKYFQQAIEKDPNYAAAYAGLAIVYSTWIPGMTRGPRDLMPKAKEFARKAMTLDNTLAAAHSQLGLIELYYDWDWSAAEEEYRQTMALNPNYVWVHPWHARGLLARGRTEEAVAEAERIVALSPSPLDWDNAVWIFVLARRCDLARGRDQELLEVAPHYVWAHFENAQIYECDGQMDKAAEEYLKADELFGTDPKKLAQLREAMAKSGTQGYWKRTLENYRESAKLHYVPPVLVAEACVRVGDKECTLKWLEKGFQERDDLMINLKAKPVFDSLHSDRRFQDLVRRVGIT